MRPAALLSLQVRPVHVVQAPCMTQILCLLTLRPQGKKNFFIFKADEKKCTGSTLIEDNAENEEIIPF